MLRLSCLVVCWVGCVPLDQGERVPAPRVTLTPSEPVTTDGLVAEVTPPNASWTWLRDGVAVDDVTGLEVPASMTRKGETWSIVAVTMRDGERSKEARVDRAIANSAPVAELRFPEPQVRTTDDLVPEWSVSDADNDPVDVVWTWSVGGAETFFSEAAVLSRETRVGQVWSVQVVPSDGESEGSPAADTVEILNAPPELSVALMPDVPIVTSTITAEITAADPDGKSLLIDQVWSVNGEAFGESESLAGVFERGDRVRLDVSATDGLHTTEASAEVLVSNSLPVLSDVRILPENPTRSDALECSFEAGVDLDGDTVTPRWSWSRDGEELSTEPTLPPMFLNRSDTVTCSVWLSDGVDETAPVAADAVIVNTLPEIEIALVPDVVTSTTPEISVSLTAFDLDDDALSYAYRWWRNDVLVSSAETLAGGDWSVADVLRVEVLVTDSEGSVSAEDEVVVSNTDPVIAMLAIDPSPPMITEEIRAAYEIIDPDDQELFVFQTWYLNGEYVSTGEVYAGVGSGGDQLSLVLTVSDGVSGWIEQEVEETIMNRSPVADPPTMEPPPRAGDGFACVPGEVSDPDGDELTVNLALFREGLRWPESSVDPGIAGHGEEWTCRQEVTDGELSVLDATSVTMESRRHNVLVILADDVGTDKIGVYDEVLTAPPTPTIDALAEQGVLFRNAWSSPVCSPTRAAMMTGRHARRTGMGAVIRQDDEDYQLDHSELTLPEALSVAGYTSAVAGKWHLAGYLSEDVGEHPLNAGFVAHRGSLTNLNASAGSARGYYDWIKMDQGESFISTTYATEDTVDDALLMMDALPEPWFLFVSFNAAHSPYQPPPPRLISCDCTVSGSTYQVYDAMVEAMDHEIGRLLAGLGDRSDHTTVMFLGDNGTPPDAVRWPRDDEEAKGTMYEGGVNVPMIVVSPDTLSPGSESDALVHVSDVFSTALHAAGISLTSLDAWVDGQSLLSYVDRTDMPGRREYLYSEWFTPLGATAATIENQMVAVRDASYKLMVQDFPEEGVYQEYLFDMTLSPDIDGLNLLDGELSEAEQAAYDRLSEQLAAYQAME